MNITDKLKQCMEENDINLYGIADIELMNEKARQGRRPADMFPSARALIIIGVGLPDTFLRGWVKNGRSGNFYSTTQIPEEYQSRDAETQNRRELTFLLQEAAFSDHIPIYCAIDLTRLSDEERAMFDGFRFTPRGAVVLGQTIRDMFLYAEQDIPGNKGFRPVTAAQLIAENYLMEYREKLEIQGYQTEIIAPEAIPDPTLSAMLAARNAWPA